MVAAIAQDTAEWAVVAAASVAAEKQIDELAVDAALMDLRLRAGGAAMISEAVSYTHLTLPTT